MGVTALSATRANRRRRIKMQRILRDSNTPTATPPTIIKTGRLNEKRPVPTPVSAPSDEAVPSFTASGIGGVGDGDVTATGGGEPTCGQGVNRAGGSIGAITGGVGGRDGGGGATTSGTVAFVVVVGSADWTTIPRLSDIALMG